MAGVELTLLRANDSSGSSSVKQAGASSSVDEHSSRGAGIRAEVQEQRRLVAVRHAYKKVSIDRLLRDRHGKSIIETARTRLHVFTHH